MDIEDIERIYSRSINAKCDAVDLKLKKTFTAPSHAQRIAHIHSTQKIRECKIRSWLERHYIFTSILITLVGFGVSLAVVWVRGW